MSIAGDNPIRRQEDDALGRLGMAKSHTKKGTHTLKRGQATFRTPDEKSSLSPFVCFVPFCPL